MSFKSIQGSNIQFYKNKKGQEWMHVIGIDFGTPNGIQVLKKNNKAILCRIPGHTGWMSRGTTGYYNPEFKVYKRVGKNQVEGMGRGLEYTRETKKEVFEKALGVFEFGETMVRMITSTAKCQHYHLSAEPENKSWCGRELRHYETWDVYTDSALEELQCKRCIKKLKEKMGLNNESGKNKKNN